MSVDSSGHIEQSTERSERGIRGSLRREPFAVDMTSLQSLSQTIEKAGDKRIVYIGEYHDRFSHHGVELQIIKSLYRKNPKIAIGMEMFQRPFQGVLDDYIRGAIEERDFLKKSEYFSRWGFDYNLYKPILDYARAEKIPVVALNLRSEIVDKVGREGIDALTDDEKKDIPPQTDFSDIDYRDRLEKIFAEHEDNSDKNFDFFYQAQVLWDETMAMSIDEYLQKNMDRQMVVLAGQGHLVYRSGIPNRVARRNRYTYATIVNETDLNKEIADYVVLPQPLVGMTAPRLMVVLKEGDGKVVIADMPTDSVSRKAGLKVGDRFVSIDNAPISSVDDVRIALFYKKEGEFVAVKVLRTRFLFGQTETVFKIQLQ